MKIKDINLLDLFTALKTFNFKHTVNGEEQTISVTLWPDEQNAVMYKMFNIYYGSLMADELSESIDKGEISVATAANVLKNILTPQWKQLWLAWVADYNPLWNVDGVESRVIETEHGLVVDHVKGTDVTSEQLVSGESTTEQLTDAKSTDYTAPYDSSTFNPAAKNESNAGKVKATSNSGKIMSSTSGTDTDEESGTTTVTDTLTRGGNIGVTMSTQLLEAQVDLWGRFNFFPVYFQTIAKQLTIPMWEV